MILSGTFPVLNIRGGPYSTIHYTLAGITAFQELFLSHKVLFFTFLKMNHGMASAMPIEMSNKAGSITLSLGTTAVSSLIRVFTSTASGDRLAIMTMMLRTSAGENS